MNRKLCTMLIYLIFTMSMMSVKAQVPPTYESVVALKNFTPTYIPLGFNPTPNIQVSVQPLDIVRARVEGNFLVIDYLPEMSGYVYVIINDVIDTSSVSATIPVIIYDALPNEAISFYQTNPGNNCAPAQLGFENSSVFGQQADYNWTITDPMGGMITYSTFSIMPMFEQVGSYTIGLQAQNKYGQYLGYYSEMLYMEGGAGSFFPQDNSMFCPGSHISFYFSNLTTSEVSWDFGDGTTDYGNWTSHSYQMEGTYTVTATFYACGNMQIVTQKVVISKNAGAELDVWMSSNGYVCPFDEIELGINGDATDVLWTMPDGSTQNTRNAKYAFADTGSYTITVTANTLCGMATKAVPVEVSSNVEASAYFQYMPYMPCPGNVVEFHGGGGGSFEWNFGDGGTAFGQHVSNRFANEGNYNVVLTVRNGCGNVASYEQVVNVARNEWNIPYVNARFEDMYNNNNMLSVCPNTVVKLSNDTWTGEPLVFSWSANGQVFSSEYNTSFTVGNQQFYTIVLSGTNACGNIGTDTLYIQTNNTIVPEVSLRHLPDTICPGEEVFFWDEDFEPTKELVYTINFGDGQQSGLITHHTEPPIQVLARHNYANVGEYQYIFTATNRCNNSVSDTGKIVVSTNANRKPFYYLGNSADGGGKEQWYFSTNPTNGEKSYLKVRGNEVGVYEIGKVVNNMPVKVSEGSYSANDSSMTIVFTEVKQGSVCAGVNATYKYTDNNGSITFTLVGDNCVARRALMAGREYTEKELLERPQGDMFVAFGGMGNRTFFWMNDKDSLQGYYQVGNLQYDTEGKDVKQVVSEGVYSRRNDTITFTSANGCTMVGMHRAMMQQNILTFMPIRDECIDRSNLLAGKQYMYQGESSLMGVWESYATSVKYTVNFGANSICLISYETFDGMKTYIYDGTYTTEGNNIRFMPSNDCMFGGEYLWQTNGDNLSFMNMSDSCQSRIMALTNSSFYRAGSNNNNDYWNSACPGDMIQFMVAGGSTYKWTFPDNTTSTEQTPVKQFNNEGVFNVSLEVTNACGHKEILNTFAFVDKNNEVFAWFDITTPNPVVGRPVQFISVWNYDGNVNLENKTYTWDFGDGTTFVGPNPEHTYLQKGMYEVNLTVTNGCGSKTEIRTIEVREPLNPCAARFYFVADSINYRTFSFINTSFGSSSTYQWDFGGIASSEEANPTFTFDKDGRYTVCLSIRDSVSGCADRYCAEVFVGQVLCSADFTFYAQGNDVTFTPVASSDSTSAASLSYWWDFGDGTGSDMMNPTHTYYYPGRYTACLYVYNQANGCQTWECKEVKVGDVQCYVSFSYYADGNNVYFADASMGIDRWYWDFGDGFVSDAPNPEHTYEKPGYYYVCLQAGNSQNNCFNSYCIEIKVGQLEQNCNADFNYFVDNATSEVKFTDMSVGRVSSHYWDFGDGGYSTDANPVHKYSRGGAYWVCLYTYDDSTGCYSDECREVMIQGSSEEPSCNAKFSYYADSTANVSFYDMSTGNTKQWYWQFGDGGYSTEQHPSHQYTFDGVYTVCLSIYNDSTGCFSDECVEIAVRGAGIGTATCNADFGYFVDPVAQEVKFHDKSSGNPTKWYWTFGDGEYSEQANASHKYAHAGLYTVCLYTYNETTGCYSQICQEVQVGQLQCDVKAEFSFFVSPAERTVTFTNTSQGTAAEYYWDFGDGVTSTEKDPSHVYDRAGYYFVGMAAYNRATNCYDFAGQVIQVGQTECKAKFEQAIDVQTNTVSFFNRSSENSRYYFWYFGDGEYSLDKEPVHNYKQPGLYYVSLTVADSLGLCFDYADALIQVGTVECQADFSVYVDKATNTAYFNNMIKGEYTHLYWEFGDGSVSFDENPQHTYTAAGYYYVGLATYNANNNCMDYKGSIVLIGEQGIDCEAKFVYQPSNDMSVKFSDKSMGDIVGYIWDFGDGTVVRDDANPQHTYAAGGYYLVCLTVYTASGIQNSTCEWIQVVEPNTVSCLTQFIMSVDSVNRKVTFVDQSYGTPNEWTWDFGDGSALNNEQNPSHTYANNGYYVVTLKTRNTSSNCESEMSAIVNIGQGPGFYADFGYEVDTTGKANGYPTDFGGTVFGRPSRFAWKFGDGESDSTTINPIHVYQSTGTYEVCLTVSDPVTKKSATKCKQVEVKASGIRKVKASQLSVSAYPNPTSSNMHIACSLNKAGQTEIKVYDVLGNLVETLLSAKQNIGMLTTQWDTQHVQPGIYYIKVAAPQGSETIRVMVVR